MTRTMSWAMCSSASVSAVLSISRASLSATSARTEADGSASRRATSACVREERHGVRGEAAKAVAVAVNASQPLNCPAASASAWCALSAAAVACSIADRSCSSFVSSASSARVSRACSASLGATAARLRRMRSSSCRIAACCALSWSSAARFAASSWRSDGQVLQRGARRRRQRLLVQQRAPPPRHRWPAVRVSRARAGRCRR